MHKIFIQLSEERKHVKVYVESAWSRFKVAQYTFIWYSCSNQKKNPSLWKRSMWHKKKYKYIPVSPMGKKK